MRLALTFFLAVLPCAAQTKVFLRNTASLLGAPVSGYAGYGCDALTALPLYKLASTTAGAAAVTKTFTPSSTTPPCDCNDGTNYFLWFTPPLSSGVTIASNIDYSLTGSESAIQLNSGGRFVLYRWSAATGGIVSTIMTSATTSEFGTSASRNAITAAAPTSTAMAVGDRIVIRVETMNVGSFGGNSSRTWSIQTDAASGSTGDTFVNFGDTLSFSADSNNAPARALSALLRRPGLNPFGR